MRKSSMVFAVAVMLAGCASSSNNNLKGKIADPEIHLVQTSSTPSVAQHITGGMPVSFVLEVTNHADVPITLKRITIQSMGSGGYNIPPTARPFNETINAGGTMSKEFWVGANAEDSVAGVNGAVAMRVIAQFATADGNFETSTVEQVGGQVR